MHYRVTNYTLYYASVLYFACELFWTQIINRLKINRLVTND